MVRYIDKMKLLILSVVLALSVNYTLAQDSPPRVVCFLRSEGFDNGYELGDKRLPCTHVIYSSIFLTPDGIARPSTQDLENIQKLNEYRNRTGNHFYMIQIGGNEDEALFSAIVSDPVSRKTLRDSILKMIKDSKFHGVDINWRFPRNNRDKTNLRSLLQELREDFEKNETMSALQLRGLTSLVLPNSKDDIVAGYSLLTISPVVDFMNVLSFDILSANSPLTDHHAPIKQVEIKQADVEDLMKLYMRVGTPAKKLVMGIPLFGRKYILDPLDNSTLDSTFVPYSEICPMRSNEKYTEISDNGRRFIYGNDEIVSFDDGETIKSKAKLALALNSGGIMFWSLDMIGMKPSCAVDDTEKQWSILYAAMDIAKTPVDTYEYNLFGESTTHRPNVNMFRIGQGDDIQITPRPVVRSVIPLAPDVGLVPYPEPPRLTLNHLTQTPGHQKVTVTVKSEGNIELDEVNIVHNDFRRKNPSTSTTL